MQKGNKTKEYIIATSAELFNIHGYSGCSINHIMNATGLKKGGVYNHFNNKDEIAIAAFEYSFNEVLKRFKTKLAPCKNNHQKIVAIIETFKSFALQPVVKGGCPIFNTAMDTMDTHPTLIKKAKEGINTLIKYVEIKIEEGKIDGEFSPQLNAQNFALFLVSSMEGALIISRAQKSTIALDNAAQILIHQLEENLQ